MRAVANARVMIDCSPGIHDDMRPDDGARIDDNARANHGARSELNIRGDSRTGMDGREESLASCRQPLAQLLTDTIVTNRNHNRVVDPPLQVTASAQHGKAQRRFPLEFGVIVQEPKRSYVRPGLGHPEQDVRHDYSVAASSNNQNAHVSLGRSGGLPR
jgi:hypothetical protein